MKLLLCLILTTVLICCLCACRQETPDAGEAATDPSLSVPPTDTEATTEPTSPTTAESTPPATTEPAHSPLYLPEVSTEEMIGYFNEVVLNQEYTDGTGDVNVVHKWNSPITYRITGTPTQEDLAVLEGLFAQLNEIPGFPGIHPSANEEVENLTISFLDEENFNLAFSAVIQGEVADGAVQFWYYNDLQNIYNGRIGYRSDISQEIRNSVILEEIINVLGITDTTLRTDSITYQYSSDATQLSSVDWALLKLLYDPAIECGMNTEACRVVLEQLYY